jgi:hypothetical protein
VCFERLDENIPIADEKKIKYFYSGEEKHRNLPHALLGDESECEKEISWNGMLCKLFLLEARLIDRCD